MPALKKVLEREFPRLPLHELSAAELEQNVTGRYLCNGAPCSSKVQLFQDWPGPQEDVIQWFALSDGSAIGILGPEDAPSGLVKFPFNKIRQIDWNRLRTCRLVYEAGSFTKAASMLRITQSAVSRQISALEEEIGNTLFIRSNTGLLLTEVGEQFVSTINRMWEALELGLAQLNEMREAPSGPIILTTTQAFGSAWLSARLSQFHRHFPSLEVKLLLSDETELNLRQRAADCAIRFKPPTELGLVRVLLAEFRYGIFASSSYIAERGLPETIEDLDNHDLVAFGNGIGEQPITDINWMLGLGMSPGVHRRAAVQMNSIYGIYRAVEAGAGLGSLPFYLSERSDDLVEVLAHVPRPWIPVYFVYPEELRSSKRIKVLRDFIAEEVRKNWTGRVISAG